MTSTRSNFFEIYDRASKPPVCSSSRSKLVDRAKTSIFPVDSSGLQRPQGYHPHHHHHYLTPFSEYSSQISKTVVKVVCAYLLDAGYDAAHSAGSMMA